MCNPQQISCFYLIFPTNRLFIIMAVYVTDYISRGSHVIWGLHEIEVQGSTKPRGI